MQQVRQMKKQGKKEEKNMYMFQSEKQHISRICCVTRVLSRLEKVYLVKFGTEMEIETKQTSLLSVEKKQERNKKTNHQNEKIASSPMIRNQRCHRIIARPRKKHNFRSFISELGSSAALYRRAPIIVPILCCSRSWAS